ncbi:MAG: glycosyltransferase family 4 protein [Thermoplasmata archaeon]|nr:MAG: glycosyltransferase family 4 protein [Thermoplasmata archaeon]
MKIAWFTDTWLPARDGVVNSLLMFKKELEKRGHDIFIFAPGERNDEKGNIFYYKSRPLRAYKNYRVSSLPSLFSRRTIKIVNKIKPDVIHSHSPGIIGIHAVIASYKLKIPLFFTYHTFVDDSVYLFFRKERTQEIVRKLVYKWLRWYFRRCSCIIAPSKYTAKILNEKIMEREIKVLPTGIDIEKFSNGDGSEIKKRYDGKKIILHVGRVVKEKNLDLLIEAAPYILEKMEAVFIIVGEGPAKEELEEKVRRMKLQEYFVFTGFVKDEDLPNYYKAADVFVFPSVYETQGIVAFEAMAAGVPVAASTAKALPDFIKDGENGCLFNPYNARECAEKIVKVMENKEIVRKASEFVKEYSIERMTDKLLDIYESKM